MTITGSGRPRVIAILLAVAAVVFVVISLRPPVSSELRYVEAGREMAADGDWVVPHLAFVPYVEKPAMIYWTEAMAQEVCGTGPVAVRLPSILAELASLAMATDLACDIGGTAFGLAAGALLLGSAFFLAMASVMTTDPLFAAWVMLAWYGFWKFDRARGPGQGRAWALVFWAAIGCGILTKGPLAAVLGLGGTLSYVICSRRWMLIRRGWPIIGPLLLVAVNLPWSWAAWRADPRYLEFFYIRENFQAFFDGSINHPGPPYYYLGILMVALVPWSLPALIGLVTSLREALRGPLAAWTRMVRRSRPPEPALATATPLDLGGNDAASGRLYIACLIVMPLLFFSVSASKLPTYILPLMPPVAIAAADGMVLARRSRLLRWSLPLEAIAVALGGIGYLISWFHDPDRNYVKSVDWDYLPGMIAAVALVVLPLWVGAWLSWRGRLVAGLATAGAGFATACMVLAPFALSCRKDINCQRLADTVASRISPADGVIVDEACVQDYTIVRTLRRRPYIHGAARELGMGHAIESIPPGRPLPRGIYGLDGDNFPIDPWLLGERALARKWRAAGRLWYFADPDNLPAMGRAGLDVVRVDATWKIVLLTNHPLAGIGDARPQDRRRHP